MAPQTDDRTLRSVNYRLKSTPVQQLPRILHHVTAQLVLARCDFTSNQSEVAWLKTRISSLLQDRSQEARFCAVSLVKTVLDLGGPDAVIEDKARVGVWIRGLLDILKKPGPVATKNGAIVALTKAFMLTWSHATLVRELTTPTLPTFITTCLQQFQGTPPIKTSARSDLVTFVLESFAQLLPRHPTVFRSFASQMQTLAVATLCNDPFDNTTTATVIPEAKDAACQLLVLLHQCAQKGGGAAEWDKAMDELLGTAHATIDQVYRAVTEDWQSVAGVRNSIIASKELSDLPQVEAEDHSKLPGWSGLRSGVERIRDLLRLMESYISTPTATSVKIPLGRIIDLLTRLLYVHAPGSRDPVGTRFNAQIGREERDELLALLPVIHTSALHTIYTLLTRFGTSSLPVCLHFLDLITWLFQAEHFNAKIRTASYQCLEIILSITGFTLGKANVKSIDKIIKACCKDLLPTAEIAKQATEVISAHLTNGNKTNGKLTDSNGSSRPTSLSGSNPASTAVYNAAFSLLPVAFHKLQAELIPKATRSEMDRTAILINHTEALAASVLNPAPQKPSLLPFLSALAPSHPVTESILRPRMPVLIDGTNGQDSIASNAQVEVEEVDEDQEEDEDELEAQVEETTITGNGLTAAAWSVPPVARTEEVQISWTTDPIPAVSTKRGADAEASSTSHKKPRTEAEAETEDLPVAVAEETYVAQERMSAAEDMTMKAAPEPQLADEGESEEEDGSDFEIPPLVMRTDFDDDEEEDEEGN